MGFFDPFGLPVSIPGTLLLAAFLGLMCLVILSMARLIGSQAMGTGLIAIAAGYLIAHYLTLLLVDDQRSVIALSDPLQRGWDLPGTAIFEPLGVWLPASLVWGPFSSWLSWEVTSWLRDRPPDCAARADHVWATGQVPLAIVMIGLTTSTLWSLGQADERMARERPH